MPRRRVTRLRKLCGLLAGHSWQQAERVSEAATGLVLEWLPDDQEVVDVLHLQLALGEKLEHHRRSLTGIDNRHIHELQLDSNLREERDESAADLRQRSLQLRDSFDGLFGPGGSKKIFEEAPLIPTDPVALHQLMGHVLDNLGNDDFPMPEPLQLGFTLDRTAAVSDLEQPHQRLGAALKALEASGSDSKHSQSLKDAEVEEVAVFTGRVMRFYEALYDLVGFVRLSDRLRKSSHRAAAGEAEPGEPEPGGPAAGGPGAESDAAGPRDQSDAGDAPEEQNGSSSASSTG